MNSPDAHTIRFAQSDIALDPAPINRDCTAARFDWHYAVDETVFVIEGSVIIEDQSGVTHELTAGGTIFFPSGSTARWYIPVYIRKVAFCRVALTTKMLAARAIFRLFRRLVGRTPRHNGAEAMFRVDSAAGER